MDNSKSTTQISTIGSWLCRYMPGLVTLLRYRGADFRHDAIAGLSVAAVALPVGIAYAEIAGAPAVQGIYCALLPLLAYALFGSSRQLIIGPDAATCLMVAAALGPLAGGDPQRYMELMISITLITGLFNIIFGISRLGFVANFLSQPILVGYLNGIALIVLVGQFPKLFGYQSEVNDFFGKLIEVSQKADTLHLPTLLLGICALAALFILKRWAPRLPAALIVAAVSIAVVEILHLQSQGVAVLGTVPGGLPALHVPHFDFSRFEILVQHAASIALISFTSGVLTAKSFARRNRYDIDANQELIAFGVCNITTGLFQGFPVTGADSRTAINNAMGGKTQLTGVIAAVTMLVFLLFCTGPLASLPSAALGAIIVVASIGLFDIVSLRELYAASRRELIFSLVTMGGVLYFDVLPGVALAIGMTLLWMLYTAAQPHVAVLGRVPGMSGFHNLADYPEAKTIPGLLLYRFDGDILFFNADYFKERIKAEIARSSVPIEWVIVDTSPINVVDITAIHKLAELREELKGQGIRLIFVRVKRSLLNFFNAAWINEQSAPNKAFWSMTVTAAVDLFEHRQQRRDKVEKEGKFG
ncbi:SulP family inorganic anion transporter [Desulfobulbus propionicus]